MWQPGPKARPTAITCATNTSNDCSFVVVSGGDRDAGGGYSDIDMLFTEEGYLHRDGTPYPTKRIS